MTTGKSLALSAGLAGALVLGVWAAPRMIHRDAAPIAAPVADVADSAAPATVPAPSPRHTARVNKTPALPASTPALHAALKPVLTRGTRMEIAAAGFNSAEQFATVAYAAHNTDVPFMVLKHRVLDEGKTLAAAIRESKPGINAAAEVVRARAEARRDVASLVS